MSIDAATQHLHALAVSLASAGINGGPGNSARLSELGITTVALLITLTRHAVDLPHMAGSMIGIAEAMRDAPEIAQVIYKQRHSHDALMTSLRPALYGR